MASNRHIHPSASSDHNDPVADGNSVLPYLVASWRTNPLPIIEDRQLVGEKGVGLFKLPEPWVPPFLVLTTKFSSLWKQEGGVLAALAILSETENELVQEFLETIVPKYSPTIFVRSNAPGEDLTLRGAYHSYVVPARRDDTIAMIGMVLGQSHDGAMSVILNPVWIQAGRAYVK